MTQRSRGISGHRKFRRYKTEPTTFFSRYFSEQKVKSNHKVKLLFTKSLNVWKVVPFGKNLLFTCNRHERDKGIASADIGVLVTSSSSSQMQSNG